MYGHNLEISLTVRVFYWANKNLQFLLVVTESLFESAYKNKGLVNCIFKSISRIAICLMTYRYFSCFHACQIGIRCSRTKKCSQTFEIDHFRQGNLSALQPSKNCHESNRGSFRFTHSIFDIFMTPSCSLRKFRNWRLVCCELHVDADFEIYGSSIGVFN